MNSGSWKAKRGKTSLAEGRARSQSVRICPVRCVCEKSTRAHSSPHWSPFLMLELSDKRRGWTLPFNEILSLVSFWDLTHSILKMVSQFELAFRTNGENAITLCLEKLARSFFQEKKNVLCGSESWRFTESLHLEISDIEIGYYIPPMSRYHAFCFLRDKFP